MKKSILATILLASLLGFLNQSANAATWYPSGYQTVPKLTPNVAYKVLPAGQGGTCVWCSARHGNYFWKVNFISKKDCSNLYINTAIKDLKGRVIGAWYQKGFYTAKMSPKLLEIVTPYKDATFEITTISC